MEERTMANHAWNELRSRKEGAPQSFSAYHACIPTACLPACEGW
jgi:hypothetical protein